MGDIQTYRISPVIDKALYERIKAVAEKEKRTVNKQIEIIIERYLDLCLSDKEEANA